MSFDTLVATTPIFIREFHFSCSSTITPNVFVSLTFLILLSPSLICVSSSPLPNFYLEPTIIYSVLLVLNVNLLASNSTAVNDQIVHFYDKNLKICRITNFAELIISRYGANSNSILVDVMEYDMSSTRTSIVKKWEIE